MGDGTVVFHGNVRYDFYLVKKDLVGGYDIEHITVPKAGALHRELTDEVVITLPRDNEDPSRLRQKLIDAYENLMFGRKH